MKLWPLLSTLLLGLGLSVSLGQPISFDVSTTTLPPQGGSVVLAWQGSESPTLSISSSSGSTSGIAVDGSSCLGPMSLSGTTALVRFPPTAQIGGSVAYSLTLSGGGASKSLTLTQAVSPILAVVNNGDATIRLYALEGITGNSTPLLTLHTSPHPVALAFDPSGNLWVGGGSCAPGGPTGQFLEEFKAPFIEGEPPTLFPDLSLSGDVLTLAFDASDHLWVGTYRCSRIGLIQEYTPSSSGLMAGMFLTPAGAPAGLAFDAQGNLWVGLVFDQGSEIQEYLAPSFSNAQLYSLPQQTGGFASLALDAVGNLYGLVGSTGAPLEELPSGIQPPANGSNPFIQLFSLPSGIYGFGLAFDASGNLWLSSFNAKTRTGQVQEFKPPFSSISIPSLSLQGFNVPLSLAIWPIPPGLPLN